MKKIKLGLFPKVVISIVIGALLGLVLPDVVIRIFKTFNVLFAQLLKFIVPLLVLGLVTPSIANLGRGAGKMLLSVVVIAYVSTVLASLFSYGISSTILPSYLSPGELSAEGVSEKEFLPYIDLKIPPICDVMTSIVLSFVIGIGIIFTDSKGLKRGFDEFEKIVKLTIEKVIIPGLPIYIFTMICEMSARGVINVVLGTGFKVILTGVVLSIVYLVIQYCIAGLIARKNPFKLLWNILPAYLTGFSICSSSACIPVTYDCTLKNGVRKDIADFVIPLCATVHMCGSAIKLTVTSVAIAYMFGQPIGFGLFLQFALMQAIAAVAAPGVMGGVLMASIGIIGTILGFSDTMTTLVMTLYLALDGCGPAANVSGDGAIAVIIDKLFGKKQDVSALEN
jgi:Na+/H+-dicarboxylate symporter